MQKITQFPYLISLNSSKAKVIEVKPDRPSLEHLARTIDVVKIEKLHASVKLTPDGARDWRLSGDLKATVTQTCGVTLMPIKTGIATPFKRAYLSNYTHPTQREWEIPESDESEPLPEEIDLEALICEVLSLAIPDFPRAPDAAWEGASFAPSGDVSAPDEEEKPFAQLLELKKRLSAPDQE